MANITGSEILAKCLKKEGIEDLFFIMGGPMLLAETSCIKEGIRLIDVRHEQAAALVVISLNGGWTADPENEKPGRTLGYTRYDKMAEDLGCYGEFVEQQEELGKALRRAQNKVDQGMVALVNVKTDRIPGSTVSYSASKT